MTTQTVSNAVAKRDTGIVSVMWDRKTHFAAVLPDHVDVKSFLGTAAAALYGNPQLMQAAEQSPDSLITAMMRCAALGHQPGTDEFYLTPRKVKGRPSVLGIEGYRGIVERMYRSGAVQAVIVREVCARDRFKFVEGEMDKPQHATGGGEPYDSRSTGADFFGENGTRYRGAMVGVYAYAILATGAVSRVVILNRDDVYAARDAGGWKADDTFSPWNRLDAGKDHPEFTGRSMWWKTAARRLEPWVPTSAEYRREQLRAAAAAATQAAPPPPPVFHRIENGPGVLSDGAEPVDAELVDEPAAEDPTHAPGAAGTAPTAAPAPAAPGAATSSQTATGRRATSNPSAPSKAAAGKLSDLLAQIPLGPPDDVAALIAWLTGQPASEPLTAAGAKVVTTFLDDHMEQAGGDVAEAASQVWTQFHESTGGK